MDPIFDDPKKYGLNIPADADMYFYGRPDGKINVFMRDAEPKDSEKISKEYPFLMTTGRVIEAILTISSSLLHAINFSSPILLAIWQAIQRSGFVPSGASTAFSVKKLLLSEQPYTPPFSYKNAAGRTTDAS